MNNKHTESHTAEEKEVDVQTLTNLVNEAKEAFSSNMCYPVELRENISKYTFLPSKTIISEVSTIMKKLQKSRDGEIFYASFYSNIVLYAEKHFLNLQKPACTLLATKVADKIFSFCKNPPQFPHKAPPKITEKEMGRLQYLAGYVVHKLKKVKSTPNYMSHENQIMIAILTNAITHKRMIKNY